MPLVNVEADGGVQVVTLDRPPVNALSGDLIAELADVVDAASADRAVRAMVICGRPRAFSAGADLREMAALPIGRRRELIERGARLMDRIERLDRPVIAAIEGFCLGGGLELAMACHLRVAAEGARLGQPEVSLGIPPGFGATRRLPRLVPRGMASEMLLTGEAVTAERAHAVGLVNAVTPSGQARKGALELARRLAAGSMSAQAAILRAMRGDQSEIDAVAEALASRDGQEGVAAFLEKRTPRFDG